MIAALENEYKQILSILEDSQSSIMLNFEDHLNSFEYKAELLYRLLDDRLLDLDHIKLSIENTNIIVTTPIRVTPHEPYLIFLVNMAKSSEDTDTRSDALSALWFVGNISTIDDLKKIKIQDNLFDSQGVHLLSTLNGVIEDIAYRHLNSIDSPF